MNTQDADFVVEVLEVTDNGGLYGSGCNTVDGTGHFQALLEGVEVTVSFTYNGFPPVEGEEVGVYYDEDDNEYFSYC